VSHYQRQVIPSQRTNTSTSSSEEKKRKTSGKKMTKSPEAPWPLVHGYLFSLPHSSHPLVPRRRRHSVTRLCDPTPCSLPHLLAYHCPPASLILPGCCDAVGMGALDPAVRGFGCVPARTGPPQHGPADAADAASPVLVAAGAALAPHASVQAVPWEVAMGEELVSGIHQIWRQQ
jgi:hypothetical protein